MPISVMCPNCDSKLNAPDAAAGKTVKCPKCKEPMVIPDPAEEAAAAYEEVEEPAPKKSNPAAKANDKPAPKKKVIIEEDGDDEDEEEDRPRKKKKGKKKAAASGLSPALIGAIAGVILLLGGGAFATYWFGFREKAETAATNSGTPQLPNYAGGPKGMPNVPGGVTPNVPGGQNPTAPPKGDVKPLYESSNPMIASYRSLSKNNLKQIGLAMHNSAGVYNNAFPAGVCDSTGNIGLSWRVAILPFLEQDSLYKQFKLNEPWNSEHNMKLVSQMPKMYAAPGQDASSGRTYYRSFSGADTIFPPSRGTAGQPAFGLKLNQIPDGTSNTALVVEAGDPVEWTKPDELVYTAGGALPRLGGIFADGFQVLVADGSVRRLKAGTPAANLQGVITAKGGEIVTFDD